MKVSLVGVMGHVDHGKTAIVRALTGVDTDRLPEEKRRGVSIELGFAPLRGEGVEVDFIDMPGHERFIRAMAGGATSVQAAVLVVAADEGICAQTREHLQIARMIGVEHMIGVVSKSDKVDRRRLAETIETVRRALCRAGYFNAPVLPVSVVSGEGLDDLKTTLLDLALQGANNPDGDYFYLPVDRAFVARGLGVVVGGSLRGRSLSIGDEVEILPSGRRAIVRGLQRHGEACDRVEPGRRVAVNLKGMEANSIGRGDALATPGALAPGEWLDVTLHAADHNSGPIRNADRAELVHGHSQTPVRVRTLAQESVDPGTAALCQLRAETPLFLPPGESFVLRRRSPGETIGGGRVLATNSGRRRKAAIHDDLTLLDAGDIAGAIASMAAAASLRSAPASTIRRVAPIGARAADLRLKGILRLRGGALVALEALGRLEASLLARLEAFHKTVPLANGVELQRICPAHLAAPPVAEAALAALAAKSMVVREGARWRLASFDPVRSAPLTVRLAAEAIELRFLKGGLKPPSPTEFTGGHALALKWLVQRGVLVRAVDRVQQREIVFHAQAVEAAGRALAAAFPEGAEFRAGEAGSALGVSRKFAIPLLEYLDARGVTARKAERRTVRSAQNYPRPG